MADEIQFEKAQFESGKHCVVCQNPLQGTYFRVNETTVCSSCAEKAKFDHQLHQSTSSGLARGILFGFGAALAGAVIHGLIAVLTGYEFALIAIFIGWMVGKAMMKGSRGKGGRKYQVTAVLITYMSITAGYLPSIVKELTKTSSEQPPDPASTPTSPGTETKIEPTATTDPTVGQPLTVESFVLGVGFLLAVAALAPFLSLTSGGISGIIGIAIIAFGLMQAWKEAREQPFAISGPFPFESQSRENEAPA